MKSTNKFANVQPQHYSSLKQILLGAFLFTLVSACVPLEQNSSTSTSINKTLRYENATYESDIKTVLLHPFRGNLEDEILPAVLPIAQDVPLLLTFDQLGSDYEDYKAKIIHCDKNWNKSVLSENEYLFTFNEFPVRDYEFSFNTRTQYTHYRFQVPKVKIPGNYLVIVYRGSNPNDLILSERFMVYSPQVVIAPEIRQSSEIAKRNQNQQIEFSINYGNIEVLNPLEDIHVVIRQNERFDNAITNLKPTFVREGQKILQYEYFDLTTNFKGGNEFRFFDLRAINYSGQNISGIEKKTDRIDAFIMRDKDRGDEAYAHYNDINGDFVINNLESSPPQTASDYVNTHFYLLTDNKLDEDVFIVGELTNWSYTNQNKMNYDEDLGGYTQSLLLKQGWYNYIYYMPESNENPYLLEGSHYQTENLYEFFVYFRPPGSRADQIIGYYKFNTQDR